MKLFLEELDGLNDHIEDTMIKLRFSSLANIVIAEIISRLLAAKEQVRACKERIEKGEEG